MTSIIVVTTVICSSAGARSPRSTTAHVPSTSTWRWTKYAGGFLYLFKCLFPNHDWIKLNSFGLLCLSMSSVAQAMEIMHCLLLPLLQVDAAYLHMRKVVSAHSPLGTDQAAADKLVTAFLTAAIKRRSSGNVLRRSFCWHCSFGEL